MNTSPTDKHEKITIVTKNIGENPEIVKIPSDTTGCLKALQKIVGGYIETIPFEDFLLICNEDGKLQNLQPNFFYDKDIIVGNVAFVNCDGEDFISLKDNQIDKIIHKLSSKYRTRQ